MKNTRKYERVIWEIGRGGKKEALPLPSFLPFFNYYYFLFFYYHFLFLCSRFLNFAEPTISEPGTGFLILSLWPQGDDSKFSTCTENV